LDIDVKITAVEVMETSVSIVTRFSHDKSFLSSSNKVYVYEKEWLFDNYNTSMKWNLQLN